MCTAHVRVQRCITAASSTSVALGWRQVAGKRWSCLQPLDRYSPHTAYTGSGTHLTPVSWSVWWKNYTSGNNEFSIGQRAELIHLVTTQLQDRGRQKPGSKGKQNYSFLQPSIIKSAHLHPLHATSWAVQSRLSRVLLKRGGFVQPHSAATSFLLVPTVAGHDMSQIRTNPPER